MVGIPKSKTQGKSPEEISEMLEKGRKEYEVMMENRRKQIEEGLMPADSALLKPVTAEYNATKLLEKRRKQMEEEMRMELESDIKTNLGDANAQMVQIRIQDLDGALVDLIDASHALIRRLEPVLVPEPINDMEQALDGVPAKPKISPIEKNIELMIDRTKCHTSLIYQVMNDLRI